MFIKLPYTSSKHHHNPIKKHFLISLGFIILFGFSLALLVAFPPAGIASIIGAGGTWAIAIGLGSLNTPALAAVVGFTFAALVIGCTVITSWFIDYHLKTQVLKEVKEFEQSTYATMKFQINEESSKTLTNTLVDQATGQKLRQTEQFFKVDSDGTQTVTTKLIIPSDESPKSTTRTYLNSVGSGSYWQATKSAQLKLDAKDPENNLNINQAP